MVDIGTYFQSFKWFLVGYCKNDLLMKKKICGLFDVKSKFEGKDVTDDTP